MGVDFRLGIVWRVIFLGIRYCYIIDIFGSNPTLNYLWGSCFDCLERDTGKTLNKKTLKEIAEVELKSTGLRNAGVADF